MNQAEIIALYDQDERKAIAYPGMRREVSPNIVRHIDISANAEGLVIYSQLNEANADEAIGEQVRFFAALGQDFEWKVYDYDQPSDLKERLASQGFIVEEAEALMVLDLADAPDILWQKGMGDEEDHCLGRFLSFLCLPGWLPAGCRTINSADGSDCRAAAGCAADHCRRLGRFGDKLR